jgi:hypothetical protein
LIKKNQIVDCPDAEAIAAFKNIIRDEWLARELGQENPQTMAALTQLMTHFCAGEDSSLARRINPNDDPSTSGVCEGNGKPRRHKKNKHRNRGQSSDAEEGAVNAGFSGQRGDNKRKPFQGSKDGPSMLDKILDKPCAIHGTQTRAYYTLKPELLGNQAGQKDSGRE